MKEQKSASNLPPVSFENFFIMNDTLKRKENLADIDIQINKQPNASLDKLLAYSLYYSQYGSWFNSPDKKMDIYLLKQQIGIDIPRLSMTINNEKYNSDSNDDINKITDNFYVKIMNTLSLFSVINLDLVNKIGISSCQNILNFISFLVSTLISNKTEPEGFRITKVKKNVSIILTKYQENIVYNFKTKFYITKDGQIYNPEFTCGDLEFSFLIDLKKNTYKFTTFKCKYNAKNCYQEDLDSSQENESNTDNQVDKADTTDKSSYFKYGIPVALGVGGIIATPFLLGTLGGKNKKIKRKKIKKSKRKKTKKLFIRS
jgi:hypothetical protein